MRGLSLAGVAFFVSGAASLVYQVAWQRILALHSGVGIYSVAMIVAAFLAGLGVGAAVGGGGSARMGARQALVAFGLVELAIAAFGLASGTIYYDWLYLRAPWLYGTTWRAALVHLLALTPPTLLMGMSLPFLVRAMLREPRAAGRTIGFLYGINVLGASAGAMLTPWLLIRFWGIRDAVAAAAAANAAAGLIALALAWRRGVEPAPAHSVEVPARGDQPGTHPFGLWVSLYALSGFCALALEILWFRIVDVAVKATAFTFGTVLALYLLGSGLGCLAGAGLAPRVRRPLRVFLVLQCVLVAYAAMAVLVLATLPADTPGYDWFVQYWSQNIGFKLGTQVDRIALLKLYLCLPVLIYGVPTVLMGLSFPVLQRAVHDDVQTSGRKVGLLQAANIAGCVAGSLVVGLGGLSWVGTTGSLRALALCGLVFAALGARVYGARSVFLPLAAGLLALAVALPGQRMLWLRLHGTDTQGPGLVQEDATSVCALVPRGEAWNVFVGGRGHSWLPFGGMHTVLGAAPAIVHPAPVDVAIIGLGSGDTAWAAGCRPETRSVTVFELAAPQPVLLSTLAAREELPDLRRFLRDPRLRLRVADGRNALTVGTQQYDLIEADALWPDAAYSGNLYSVEFFARAASRLKPGGVMCTWSPTDRVYGSFTRAFPYVVGTSNVLIGSNDPIVVDREAWKARLAVAESTYLGRRAPQLPALLDELRPLNVQGLAWRRHGVNEDLFPRDEFLTP
jgi:spermidine synthase